MRLQHLTDRPAPPSIEGATHWLNAEKPVELGTLKGKVVLVDFWTYGCGNCVRTLPYLRALDAKYRRDGLAIVGIHSPEFASEKVRRNVEDALVRHRLDFPVAMDNDHTIWRRWGQRYWPTQYLIDKQGAVAFVHIGEGDYEAIEDAIVRLLRE